MPRIFFKPCFWNLDKGTYLLLVPKALLVELPPNILELAVFDAPNAGLGAPPPNMLPVLFVGLVLWMMFKLATSRLHKH